MKEAKYQDSASARCFFSGTGVGADLAQLFLGLNASCRLDSAPSLVERVVVGDRDRSIKHFFCVPVHPRQVHVTQHAPQVSVNVLDLFEACATQDKLNESILDQVFSTWPVLIGKSQGPSEQLFITLGEQFFPLLFSLGSKLL